MILILSIIVFQFSSFELRSFFLSRELRINNLFNLVEVVLKPRIIAESGGFYSRNNGHTLLLFVLSKTDVRIIGL